MRQGNEQLSILAMQGCISQLRHMGIQISGNNLPIQTWKTDQLAQFFGLLENRNIFPLLRQSPSCRPDILTLERFEQMIPDGQNHALSESARDINKIGRASCRDRV